MEFLNKFIKGAVTDIDYQERNQLTWDFPAKNIRVFNREGQGLIITNVDGNEQAFLVSDSFVIVGAAELNGIIYILSKGPQNYGEIGCFPAPAEFTITNTEFVNEYKPLNNMISLFSPAGDVPTRFASVYFDLDLKRVELEVKPDYDTSTNIYIVDNKNPNRVINSGFKVNGNINQRYHKETEFYGAINQIPTTLTIPRLTPGDVESGGRLPPGNYFVYLRYCTESYARTHFLINCGPITISEGNNAINTQGLPERDRVRDTPSNTVKKFFVNIENLDDNYKFFELAVIRWSADTDLGEAKAYGYLLTRQYPTSTSKVYITGFENASSFSQEEILAMRMPYSICKSQAQTNDAWIGANWRKKNDSFDYDAFKTYASKITIGWQYGDDIIGNIRMMDIENGSSQLTGYKDPANTQRVGHFRGEIYPYGIVGVFDDNTETDVYPITGNIDGVTNTKGLYRFPDWQVADDYTKPLMAKMEFGNMDEGAYAYYFANRSKFTNLIGIRIVRGERLDNFLYQGVTFQTYNQWNHQRVSDEWVDRKCGFGERDGLADDGAYSFPLFEGLLPTAVWRWPEDGLDEDYSYWGAAAWGESLFEWSILKGIQYEFLTSKDDAYNCTKSSTIKDPRTWEFLKVKLALVSPDLTFEEKPIVPATSFIQLKRKFIPNYADPSQYPPPSTTVWRLRGVENQHDLVPQDDWELMQYERIQPKYVGADFNPYDPDENHQLVDSRLAKAKEIRTSFIDRFTQRGEDYFSSWMPGEFFSEYYAPDHKYTTYNRSVAACRYIGITDDSVWNEGTDQEHALYDYKFHLVSIYKNDPELVKLTVVSAYDVFASEYKEIFFFPTKESGLTRDPGGILPMTVTASLAFYGGDCYLQKSYIRMNRWYGYDKPGIHDYKDVYGKFAYGDGQDGSDLLSSKGYFYQWGFFVGIVTENKYNADLRSEVDTVNEKDEPVTYSFLPKCINDFVGSKYWIVYKDRAAMEANQINSGYNVTRSHKIYLGYDELRNYGIDIVRPNRIYYSYKNVAGALVDNYRNIGTVSFKDYNIQDGPFTSVKSVGGFIVGIQENAIIQIFVEERVINEGGEDASSYLVLGTSNDFLSAVFKPLASYGSQHQFSVLNTGVQVYGIDWRKRILWSVSPTTYATGGSSMNAIDIGLKFGILKYLETLFDAYSYETDIMGLLPDDTLNGLGVFTGYDPKFKEVLFAFVHNGGLPSHFETYNVLVFSELINAFIGEYSIRTRMFFNNGMALYSPKMELLDPDLVEGPWELTNQIYKHNEGNKQMFYDARQPLQITFVVNGLTEGNNLSTFKKIFESLHIDMNDVELSSILFQTEYQSGTYTFRTNSTAKFWEDSEYIEHGWQIPIIVQSSLKDNDFDQESEFRGRWLLVTITYNPGTTAQAIYIKSVLTKFSISFA